MESISKDPSSVNGAEPADHDRVGDADHDRVGDHAATPEPSGQCNRLDSTEATGTDAANDQNAVAALESGKPAGQAPEPSPNGASPLEYALAYHAAGLSVMRIRADGTKKPDGKWEAYQNRRPSTAHVNYWWRDNDRGIAMICGVVSGNREVIDFDHIDLFEPWCELVKAQAPGLLERLAVVASPNGTRAASSMAIRRPMCRLRARDPGQRARAGPKPEVLLPEVRLASAGGEGGRAVRRRSGSAGGLAGWRAPAGRLLTYLPATRWWTAGREKGKCEGRFEEALRSATDRRRRLLSYNRDEN
jgi:hypothetical protein